MKKNSIHVYYIFKRESLDAPIYNICYLFRK
jgi:hypothetical protein